MPKSLHHGKSKKSKKRRHARRFTPPVSRQITPSEGISDTAAPSPPVSPSLPAGIRFPYLLADLKKIAIMAGIAFVILIVLSLVL